MVIFALNRTLSIRASNKPGDRQRQPHRFVQYGIWVFKIAQLLLS
jgi:hypothetical protein